MAIPIFKSILYAILFGCVAMSCNFTEASLVTNKFPMLTYAEQNVPTYDKPGGGQKGFISPEVALVYIKQIRSDGWAYGSYPIAGGKRIYRWFRMNELQGYLNFNNYEMTVENDQIAYRTSSGNSRLGSLNKNDRVIVIAERGDFFKIIYKVGGGNEYKMGWIAKHVEVPGPEPTSGPTPGPDDPYNSDNGKNVYNYYINNYNIKSEGDTVIGPQKKESHDNKSINIDNSQNDNRVYDQSIHDSEIDNSVNKGAKINSENTENSHNTTNSGNKNVDNNREQIKKEQVKEEQVKKKDKLKIEIIHNPGIDKVLKNQNTSNENKTGSNNNTTGSSNTKKD